MHLIRKNNFYLVLEFSNKVFLYIVYHFFSLDLTLPYSLKNFSNIVSIILNRIFLYN